jgi:hypothetical protein
MGMNKRYLRETPSIPVTGSVKNSTGPAFGKILIFYPHKDGQPNVAVSCRFSSMLGTVTEMVDPTAEPV